jgi:hypothetical protein
VVETRDGGGHRVRSRTLGHRRARGVEAWAFMAAQCTVMGVGYRCGDGTAFESRKHAVFIQLFVSLF